MKEPEYKARYERLIEGLERLAQFWEAREAHNPYAKSLRDTLKEEKLAVALQLALVKREPR